jgi:Primase X
MMSTTTIGNISKTTQDLEKSVIEGLDLIVSNLNEPIWPRKISTKTTEGRQVMVSSKQEALAWYKAANFLDCRISAYPYHGRDFVAPVSRQTIDLIMIDLDLSTFESSQALDRKLSKTLRNIRETFGNDFTPSVLWSGNGYHIYIPIEARYILEQTKEFSKYQEPSKQFLRFAERYLSNGKCDSAHNSTVSLANCMLRIPGSHNSKCVQRNHATADSTTQVRIIQDWNRNTNTKQRAPIYLLLGSFLAYLVDEQLVAAKKQYNNKFSKNAYRHNNYNNNHNHNSSSYYSRLEKLLHTPIADHRKRVCYLLLSRYLINIKHLGYEQAYAVIKNWLLKCNEVERLSPSVRAFDTLIKNDIKEAQKSGKIPIGEKKLMERSEELYELLLSL